MNRHENERKANAGIDHGNTGGLERRFLLRLFGSSSGVEVAFKHS
jgi:hypothetical protein